MNIETIKSEFQAIASRFAADRDAAVANINKLIFSGGDNIDALVEQMGKLTISKLNIANTQDELNKVIASIVKDQEQVQKEEGGYIEEPSGNRPE